MNKDIKTICKSLNTAFYMNYENAKEINTKNPITYTGNETEIVFSVSENGIQKISVFFNSKFDRVMAFFIQYTGEGKAMQYGEGINIMLSGEIKMTITTEGIEIL